MFAAGVTLQDKVGSTLVRRTARTRDLRRIHERSAQRGWIQELDSHGLEGVLNGDWEDTKDERLEHLVDAVTETICARGRGMEVQLLRSHHEMSYAS